MKYLIIFVLFSSLAQADSVYKCIDDKGRPSFSQQPCGDSAEKIDVKGPAMLGSVSLDHGEVSRIKSSNMTRDASREISRQYKLIDQYQGQRDRAIAVIQAKQSRARNNLAGATWLQSLAKEMEVVGDKYNRKVDAARGRIDRLNDRVADL